MSYYAEAARHLERGMRVTYKCRDGSTVRGTITGTTIGGGKRVRFDDREEDSEFGSMAACDLRPIPEATLAIEAAIKFIAGFEGDNTQGGVPEALLTRLRGVIAA